MNRIYIPDIKVWLLVHSTAAILLMIENSDHHVETITVFFKSFQQKYFKTWSIFLAIYSLLAFLI